MEVVFMERQARFLNSISVMLIMFFCQNCNLSTNEHVPFQLTDHKISDSLLKLNQQNGCVYLNDSMYSGFAFQLYENGDTSNVRGYWNGKLHGISRQYYPGKKLRELRYFDQGKKVGALKTWWPNGKMQWLYHFEVDEYEGTCREWNEAGRLVKEMNYHQGQEQGFQRTWYDNGKIRANYRMESGRRYGLLGTKNCVNVSDSIFKK